MHDAEVRVDMGIGEDEDGGGAIWTTAPRKGGKMGAGAARDRCWGEEAET